MINHNLGWCNWTLGNKLQRNRNRNLCISIEENAFENAVWKMASILSRPQCVNHQWNTQLIESCIHVAVITARRTGWWWIGNWWTFNQDGTTTDNEYRSNCPWPSLLNAKLLTLNYYYIITRVHNYWNPFSPGIPLWRKTVLHGRGDACSYCHSNVRAGTCSCHSRH